MRLIGLTKGECLIKPNCSYSGTFEVYQAQGKDGAAPCFARLPGTDLYTGNFQDKDELIRGIEYGRVVFK